MSSAEGRVFPAGDVSRLGGLAASLVADASAALVARDSRIAEEVVERDRSIDDLQASYVFPSAGPPCFLDEELWGFNDIFGDESNIFPDQQVYLDWLKKTRPAGQISPDGLRRPTWLMRPLKPAWSMSTV